MVHVLINLTQESLKITTVERVKLDDVLFLTSIYCFL